jgi:hypothetical protein
MTDKPARPAPAKKAKKAAPAKKTPQAKERPAAKPAKVEITQPAAVAPITPVSRPEVAAAPKVAPARSVSEQLGGAKGFDALSEKVSGLLVSDPRINHALFGTPRGELVEKVRSLLSVAAKEAEHDLHGLFAALRENGFKDGQFAHLLVHLKDAAEQLGHPKELAQSLVAATEKAYKKVFKA